MKPEDFIATARELVGDRRGRPRETNLRRAVSTAYYAMFHCMATSGADLLVGGQSSKRSLPAWRQAYRALDHQVACRRCRKTTVRRFPKAIQGFAITFAVMHDKRNAADYDPLATFFKSDVIASISSAEQAIFGFQGAPKEDQRAFMVFVMLTLRQS